MRAYYGFHKDRQIERLQGARALPLIAQDPRRVADCPMSGPEAPSGDVVRARFFGEV